MQEQKQQKKPQVAMPPKKENDQASVNASETKTDLGRAMGRVTIIHGAHEVQYDVAGKSVQYIREALVDVLNIDPQAAPLIDGVPVNADTVLQENAVLEFIKQSGTKGATLYSIRV